MCDVSLQICATRSIHKGEELVATGHREDAHAAWATAKQEQSKVERLERAGRLTAAAGAAEKAEEVEAAAECAAWQLQAAMMEQLLPSGWRQHTMDVFFHRHTALAALVAGRGAAEISSWLPSWLAAGCLLAAWLWLAPGRLSGCLLAAWLLVGWRFKEAAQRLQLGSVRARALARYYGSCVGSSSEAGGADVAARQALQAALEASLVAHPPPDSIQALEQLLALKPSQRFRRFDGFERPLQPRSDFTTLQPETAQLLDRLVGAAQGLPEVSGQGGETRGH